MDICELSNLLELVKQEHSQIARYDGVFATGDFGDVLFDYGRGFLDVTVSSIVDTYNKETKEMRLQPLVAISTIDDGVWQAFTVESMSQKDANQLVDDIYSKWEWKYQLPSEQEMNEFLSQFKMWGENTG